LGSSCTYNTQTHAFPTPAHTPAEHFSRTDPTSSFSPTSTRTSHPTSAILVTATIFPTANIIHSDAVGFITRDNNLWIANADGSGEKRLGVKGKDFAWSPDGKWIAY